jgi:sarcosine oxidase
VSRDAEIVVVGAGVMGLATARALARAGRDVLLCEQFRLGHDRGSSHGASRIYRFSYPERAWVERAVASLPHWRELEAEAGEALLELHGSIDLGDWEPNRQALAAAGAEHEVLERAEAERRFGLALEPGERALFQPQGGIARADRTLAALAASVRAHDGTIAEETRVLSLAEQDGGVRVELESGAVSARAAVVTAGAWAPRLVDLDGAEPTRETTAYFRHEGPIPSLIDTAASGVAGYALTAPGRGAKAGLHKSGPRLDPDAPGGPDAALAAAAGEWLSRRLPAVDPEPQLLETCLYTNLPGDRFACERRGSVVVGSACSGHGFKFAPLIGAELAELALTATA